MSTKLILFITIHLAVLIFFIEFLRRIYIRAKEYDLKEDRDTLPFGLIRLRHVIILLVLSYILWFIGSLFLYHYFIDPTVIENGESTKIFNFNW